MIVGSLSNNDGDASNFFPLIPSRQIRQMLAIFLWSWILKYCIEVQEKKGSHSVVFTSSTKRENRHFLIVVVQCRQRNVQKSVQNFCFVYLNLLLFCRSSLTSPSSLLNLSNTLAHCDWSLAMTWVKKHGRMTSVSDGQIPFFSPPKKDTVTKMFL